MLGVLMGRKYEKTQKTNPHSLTINQHVWPAASIARFSNASGLVDIFDKLRQLRRPAAPNDDLFVAKRVWDQRAESGYMRKIEDAFQALTSEIVADNIVAIADEHKRTIDEFYALWNIRAKVRHLEPQDFTQSGLLGDDLTLDQQEILEKNGYTFMRPTGVPSRMLYGLRMQFEIRQTIDDLSATQWGLVRPLSGHFLVPDNPKITMIPVSPMHCLCAGGQNGIITEQNLREINDVFREVSDAYYFALDLDRCP
jgi:hypothetical protein